MIITKTPFRISFFGGGTDYPGWYREHGGAVLSTSINKYCYITCRFLPPFFEHTHRIVYSRIENVNEIDEIQHPSARAVMKWFGVQEGIEIHHDGDLPARSGLGSSSAFTVGLTHAFFALYGKMATKRSLAKNALYIEQELIGEHVGSQDQIAATFGGFNLIEFRQDNGFDVTPVILPKRRMDELHSHLMLCFTGISRFASEVAKATIDNLQNRTTELRHMRKMVDEGLAILTDQNVPIEEFGKLLDEGWRYKRSLSDKISIPEVDEIYETARSAGAIGGKLLGAGGGGFFLLFARPEDQPAIREKLSHLVHVPFEFEHSGSQLVLYQPNG